MTVKKEMDVRAAYLKVLEAGHGYLKIEELK